MQKCFYSLLPSPFIEHRSEYYLQYAVKSGLYSPSENLQVPLGYKDWQVLGISGSALLHVFLLFALLPSVVRFLLSCFTLSYVVVMSTWILTLPYSWADLFRCCHAAAWQPVLCSLAILNLHGFVLIPLIFASMVGSW